MRRVSTWLWLVPALVACADHLPKATQIAQMRILGSRIEVVGDEARSTPRPGEEAQLFMYAVFPDPRPPTDIRSMFISCTAPSRYTGSLPICQELLDAVQSGVSIDPSSQLNVSKIPCTKDEDSIRNLPGVPGVTVQCQTGAPAATVRVASGFKAAAKLVLGVVCERGRPYIDVRDPTLFGCNPVPASSANGQPTSGEAIRVNATIRVAHTKADENLNPDPSDLLVLLDPGPLDKVNPDLFLGDAGGSTAQLGSDDQTRLEAQLAPRWNEGDGGVPNLDMGVGDAGIVGGSTSSSNHACNSDDARLVDLAPNHRIALLWPNDAREKVGKERERTEISIYATAGKLQRRFTVFASDLVGADGYLRGDVGWDPPSSKDLPRKPKDDPDQPGLFVRFFITVRDGRGGFAFVTREACAGGPKARH